MPTLPPNPSLPPEPTPPVDIDAAFADFLALHKVQAVIALPGLFTDGAELLAARLGVTLKESPRIVFQSVQEMSKE